MLALHELAPSAIAPSRFGFVQSVWLLDVESAPGCFGLFGLETRRCEITYARNNPLKYVDPDGRAIRQAGIFGPDTFGIELRERRAAFEAAKESFANASSWRDTAKASWDVLRTGFAVSFQESSMLPTPFAMAAGPATALRSFSLEAGGMVQAEFQTSKGAVQLLADAAVEGRTLTLSNTAIYPAGSAKALDLGAKEVLAMKKALVGQAKALGIDKIVIEGERLTGANPGKIVRVVIDAIKESTK